MSAFRFILEHVDPNTGARAGRWITPHGEVETPAFMPVGTLATVKGLLPDQLREAGAQMVLSNTYHLALRPGEDVVAEFGGLHKFMGWSGPMLTDSGGFQVFSLAKLSKLDDQSVRFRSHINGDELDLSPERAVEIQEALGADCIMCLDQCPPHDVSPVAMLEAVDRTSRWAERCLKAQKREDQALLGIVQGGIDPKLRARSAEALVALNFPGYAIGGLSVGEDPKDMYSTLEVTTPLLPQEKLRYLMGVGKPVDLLEAIVRGVDLFDCVMPTRNGRNAMAFTTSGDVRIKNRKYRHDQSPLDAESTLKMSRETTKGYLRHLFVAGEMLGPILLSWNNTAYYQQLVKQMREAIFADRSAEFRAEQLARWGCGS